MELNIRDIKKNYIMGKIESIRQFLAKREGKTENPKGSNNIDCNTWFYGKEVSGDAFPWCVVEIVHAFFKTGNGSLIKKTASSSDLYRYYSSKNQIVKSPKAGDIVFFKFSIFSFKTLHSAPLPS